MTVDDVNVYWVLKNQEEGHWKVIQGVDDRHSRLFAYNELLTGEVGGNSTLLLMTLMSLFWYRIQEVVCSHWTQGIVLGHPKVLIIANWSCC